MSPEHPEVTATRGLGSNHEVPVGRAGWEMFHSQQQQLALR